MKSLIVDDDLSCRTVFKFQLSKYGECDLAASGSEALFAVTSALDKGEPYDFIVLDIMMPDMQGDYVLSSIRSIENERGMTDNEIAKILIVTALDDEMNRKIQESLRKNFESYMVKNQGAQDLTNKLEEFGFNLSSDQGRYM